MRTTKTLYNVAGQVVALLVTSIVGFVLPRLLITAYGSMINGLISSVRQILLYLNQMEFGLAGATTLALYKPLATRADADVSRVLSASRRYFNQIGLAFSAASCMVAVLFPYFVDCQRLSRLYVGTLVLLLALSGAASFFLVSSTRVLLIADQRSYVLSLVASAMGLVTLVASVLAVRARSDVMAIPIITATSVVAQAGLLRAIYRRTYGRRFRDDLATEKGVISQRWSVFISEMALLVQLNSPMIIVTLTLGLVSASVYSIYQIVFRTLHAVAKMLPLSLTASLGELLALRQNDRLRSVFAEYEFVTFYLTGWIYTVTALVLFPFIKYYTRGITDANYVRPSLGVLFILIGVVRQLQGPVSSVVFAAGRYRETQTNSITVAVSSVVLGFVGAFAWGLEGVLVGLAIASLHKTLFVCHYAHKRILLQSPWPSVGRAALNLLLGLVAWVPFGGRATTVAPSSFREFSAYALIAFVWTGVISTAGNALVYRRQTRAVAARVRVVMGTLWAKHSLSG